MYPHTNNEINFGSYDLVTSSEPIKLNTMRLYNFNYSYPTDVFQSSYNILIELENIGSVFWLDNTGKICHYSNNIVRNVNRSNLSQLLSSLLGRQIYIFRNTLEFNNKTKKTLLPRNSILLLSTLRIVNGEVFATYANSGFINQSYSINVFYRNTFHRSFYLETNKRNDIKFSIIIEYINYISNYNIDKFNYIMSLLSKFVKHISMVTDLFTPSPTSNILVFVANKDSGIDILINEILIPLCGSLNCIEINDDTMQNHDIKNQAKNKILYIFNNITAKTTTNKTKKEALENFFCPTDYLCSSIDIKIITAEKSYLPFNIKFEYSVFMVSGSLENFLQSIKENNINTIDELKNKILLDLENFANILRAYVLKNKNALTIPKDVDVTIRPALEYCVAKFADGLKNDNNLLTKLQELYVDKIFKDIEKLYDKHKKVERKYIYEVFKQKYDYDISATILYKKLKEIDGNLFKTVLAPGGAKCFYFPDKN